MTLERFWDRFRDKLCLLNNAPVAEVSVGAACDGGGLEVGDEVALALQQAALVVGRLAAVGEGGPRLARRRVDDLADGREALGAEAGHARPRLGRLAARRAVVRRAVPRAVAGEAAQVRVLPLRRPEGGHWGGERRRITIYF